MSLSGGISGSGAPGNAAQPAYPATGSPSVTGQTPGSGSVPGGASLLRAFNTSFQRTAATVFDIAAGGGFDDEVLARKEANLLDRLRGAASQFGGDVLGGGGSGGPTVVGGSHAAPVVSVNDFNATARELLDVRLEQSKARVAKVGQQLAARYPAAASIPNGYNPTTYIPKSEDDARAFAERIAVDLTTGAAELEVVKSNLDIARFEAENRGVNPATDAKVAALQAQYDRQIAAVDSLAVAVDKVTGGAVSDVGEDVLAGQSLRAAEDVPVEALAAEMRRAGLDEDSIEAVTGAGELAVEEAQSPGGSKRLDTIVDTAKTAMVKWILDQWKKDSVKAAEERRISDEKAEDRRAEQVAINRNANRRAADENAAEQAAAERRARFQINS